MKRAWKTKGYSSSEASADTSASERETPKKISIQPNHLSDSNPFGFEDNHMIHTLGDVISVLL